MTITGGRGGGTVPYICLRSYVGKLKPMCTLGRAFEVSAKPLRVLLVQLPLRPSLTPLPFCLLLEVTFLSTKTETEVMEDYLHWRWAMSEPALGPMPEGGGHEMSSLFSCRRCSYCSDATSLAGKITVTLSHCSLAASPDRF